MIVLRFIIFLERLKFMAIRPQDRYLLLAQQAPGRTEPPWYDDFNAPLGQDRVRERPPRAKAILLSAVLSAGSLAAALAPLVRHGLEEEKALAEVSGSGDFSLPATMVSSNHAQSAGPDQARDISLPDEESETNPPLRLPFAAAAPLGRAGNGGETSEAEAGVKILRAGGAAAPGPLIIDVAKALRVQAGAAVDSRMLLQPANTSRPQRGEAAATPPGRSLSSAVAPPWRAAHAP